jgi:hypothetical protein
MRGVQLKKFLLIPTILATGLLALVFLMPATAAGVLRTVAPGVHLAVPSVLTAAPASKPAGAAVVQGQRQAGNAPSSLGANFKGTALEVDRGHPVTTAGRMDCGRFGNGFHGGKHDFPCPNRPFPAPAS